MKSSPKKPTGRPEKKPTALPLSAVNYIMIGIGAAVIALSYLGMYLEREVDGFFSLYVSPIALVAAYAWIVLAVLYRRKQPSP